MTGSLPVPPSSPSASSHSRQLDRYSETVKNAREEEGNGKGETRGHFEGKIRSGKGNFETLGRKCTFHPFSSSFRQIFRLFTVYPAEFQVLEGQEEKWALEPPFEEFERFLASRQNLVLFPRFPDSKSLSPSKFAQQRKAV